jgi:hypothetical protein
MQYVKTLAIALLLALMITISTGPSIAVGYYHCTPWSVGWSFYENHGYNYGNTAIIYGSGLPCWDPYFYGIGFSDGFVW